MTTLKTAALLGLVLALASCQHGFQPYRACGELKNRDWPQALSETGLYQNTQEQTLARDVEAFAPRFALWTDGATKRRWIQLPPGARIDTSDMDAWRFPTGTRLWKEFTRDGVRIETRLLEKTGPGEGNWRAIAYVWNAEQTNAYPAPDGVVDALGTAHDVPAADRCMGCHGGTSSRVLGFSAIQLARPDRQGRLTLPWPNTQAHLTHPPERPILVPGDAQTQRVLGYLHANCGHCHNQRRPPNNGFRCFDPKKTFDLTLRTDQLDTAEATPLFQTALGDIVVPGAPRESPLIKRFRKEGAVLARMPPLATETVHDDALNMLSRWIKELPNKPAPNGSSSHRHTDTDRLRQPMKTRSLPTLETGTR